MISRTTFIATFAAVLAFGASAAARATATEWSAAARPLASRVQPRIADTVRTTPPSARAVARAWIGGVHTTSTGERVTVYVSESVAPRTFSPQEWAEFFVRLSHGPEIERVRIYVALRAEIFALCGSDGVVACYDPRNGVIYTPGDRGEFAPLEHVAAHEYGHHVANNRFNPPWNAGEWGTKRWASYEGVCALARQGVVFPGDQGADYANNPGESFAEAYAHLNAQRLGPWILMQWDFAEFFFPDAAALAAIEQDVLRPWSRPTIVRWRARVRRAGSVVTRAFATPLDGSLAVQVSSRFRGRVSVIGPQGRVIASRAGRAVVATVCGARSLRVRLNAARAGTFTVALARP